MRVRAPPQAASLSESYATNAESAIANPLGHPQTCRVICYRRQSFRRRGKRDVSKPNAAFQVQGAERKASLDSKQSANPAGVAGRREVAGIARLATVLTQRPRHRWGLPRKKEPPNFHQGPGRAVSYQALTRRNPKALTAQQDTHSEALNRRPTRNRNRPGS